MYEKDYISNHTIRNCGNGEYLASVIDDSVIKFGEVIEETKSIPININEKKITVKQKISIFYLPFY